MREPSLNETDAPPPLADARHPAKKFSSHFLFCARPIFSSKRKRKFFCFGFRAQSAGRRGFALARGQKFPPPNPLHFCPLANFKNALLFASNIFSNLVKTNSIMNDVFYSRNINFAIFCWQTDFYILA